MVKLVETGDRNIDDLCSELLKDHPNWFLLDKDQIISIAASIGKGKNELWNKTFIIPGYLVSARTYQSRINKLVSYMAYQSRKRNCTFIVVASSPKSIDIRLRHIIDKEI